MNYKTIDVIKAVANGRHTTKEICEICHISEASFFRHKIDAQKILGVVIVCVNHIHRVVCFGVLRKSKIVVNVRGKK